MPEFIAHDPGVTPLAKVVLLFLVGWARGNSVCWAVDARLARRAGVSVASIQRALRSLEKYGWIVRERAATNVTGRVFHLTWLEEGPPAGSPAEVAFAVWQADPIGFEGVDLTEESPAPRGRAMVIVPPLSSVTDPPRSRVRDNQVVIVRERSGEKSGNSSRERRRLEPIPATVTPPDPPPSSPRRPAPKPMPPTRAAEPLPSPAPADIPPRTTSPVSGPVAPLQRPTAPPAPAVLTPQEQARLAELPEATRSRMFQFLTMGDPILLAEARKLLRPPTRPEPPPQSLTTHDLISELPGRPDRIAHAAGRLTEDLKDPRSYRYYQGLAEAVACREHPAEALLRAWNQGMNPKAERPGAVFATAWKREVRSPA